MGNDPAPTVALFARYPTPGLAKTRLIPAIGADRAAAIHRTLVERTIATVREAGLAITVWTTGAEAQQFTDWLGPDTALAEQGEGDLGARLARVPAPAILLGADIPGLAATHLRDAADALQANALTIGPANDGGYYLLGFNAPVPWLLNDMEWGIETVFGETMKRINARGLSCAMLDPLDDLDRPEDLARWPGLRA